MEKKERHFSVGKKVNLFIIFMVFLVSISTAIVTYIIAAKQMERYYKQVTQDTAHNFAAFLDPEFFRQLREVAESEEFQAIRDAAEEANDDTAVDAYLEEHGLLTQYRATQDMLHQYLENMESVKYLYICVLGAADAQYDMYLMDDTDMPDYQIGYYETREDAFFGLDASGEVEPTISVGEWGWLCSAYSPLYDTDGSLICHVGCDFSMDDLMAERQRFLIWILVGAVLITAAVLVVTVLFINDVIIKPIHLLTEEMQKFKPAKNISYQDAGVLNLTFRFKDEIHELYEGIRMMQIRMVDDLNDISALERDKAKAENDIRNKELQIGEISQAAFRDALTSVGSKAAYIQKTKEIDAEIAKGSAHFAIVMIDLNDLKRINDKHGHKAGDSYIRNCCRIICNRYKHSPVFRIGGDEFVAILQNEDYKHRFEYLELLKATFEASSAQTDVEPWECCSASAGMAELASDDCTVEMVWLRADRAMYEAKEKYKEKHGSYR